MPYFIVRRVAGKVLPILRIPVSFFFNTQCLWSSKTPSLDVTRYVLVYLSDGEILPPHWRISCQVAQSSILRVMLVQTDSRGNRVC